MILTISGMSILKCDEKNQVTESTRKCNTDGILRREEDRTGTSGME